MSSSMALVWVLVVASWPTVALVAVLRVRREDIPKVMESLARWRRR